VHRSSTQRGDHSMSAASAKGDGKPAWAGKAKSDIPALKPYRGKPAVRNFREGDGNSGIIEARQAPLPYPTPATPGNRWTARGIRLGL